jgi:hypothetical protein
MMIILLSNHHSKKEKMKRKRKKGFMVDCGGIRPHSNLPVLYAGCRLLAAMILSS